MSRSAPGVTKSDRKLESDDILREVSKPDLVTGELKGDV